MGIKIDIENLQETNKDIEASKPYFAGISPEIEEIKEAAEKHSKDNLIVIGNGGSITSFRAMEYAFAPELDKNIRIVSTMEPDYLNRLSKEFSPENTLVMPISKSGSTTGVLESLMFFMNKGFPVFAVTSDNDGALRKIVEEKNVPWIEHRDVGGRFSGLTETGLVPAAFAGLEISEVRKGADKMYSRLEEDQNLAYRLASGVQWAKENGYEDILNPIYSTRLLGFLPLFIQLVHETVCKEGKGVTVYGDLGPEYQHHTNQRMFGGEEDILPIFLKLQDYEKVETNVPDDLNDIDLRDKKLEDLDGMSLSESLESEYQGVRDALEDEERPHVTLSIDDFSHQAVGELVAFFQAFAVYLARFQEVDPYTQPDVEKSKKIGFEKRFE